MLKLLGPLRTCLFLIGVTLLGSAPFASSPARYHGIELYTSVIAPVLTPILFFVLPLDMTMCWVMKKENRQGSAPRYAKIIRFEFLLMVLLFLAWLPFMYRLTSA